MIHRCQGRDIHINQYGIGHDCQIIVRGSGPTLNCAKAMVKDIIEMEPSKTYPGSYKVFPIPSEHVSRGFPNSRHTNRDSYRHPTHPTQHPQDYTPEIRLRPVTAQQYSSVQTSLPYTPSQPYLGESYQALPPPQTHILKAATTADGRMCNYNKKTVPQINPMESSLVALSFDMFHLCTFWVLTHLYIS